MDFRPEGAGLAFLQESAAFALQAGSRGAGRKGGGAASGGPAGIFDALDVANRRDSLQEQA